MTDEERTLVTCAGDIDEGELQVWLDNLTDLDVYLDIDDAGVTVEQLAGSCTFAYPFDLQDMFDWTCFFENDYTVRCEILADIRRLLARNPAEGRDDQAIEDFLEQLLLSDWIATDGSELMIMDVDGQPLELTAYYAWTTTFTGDDVKRPYRPDFAMPTRARLYPDGRLVLSDSASAGPGPIELNLSVVGLDEALVRYGESTVDRARSTRTEALTSEIAAEDGEVLRRLAE